VTTEDAQSAAQDGSVSGHPLDRLEAAAWSEAARSGRLELMELVSVRCAEQHCLLPLLPTERSVSNTQQDVDGLSSGDRALLDFALQFSVDVSSVTDQQRVALNAEFGNKVANVAAVVFVIDFVPRARAALHALFGDSSLSNLVVPGFAPEGPGIWDALVAFARAIPRLDALDPVTTELIRLRGARQHQCRLCVSLRSRPALLAGADEELFCEVDEYETSDLSPLQKAALALTDAMVWTPARVDSSASRLRNLATTEQQAEVVLDVTRNALNKIAVALGADAAHVDEGIEIYDLDARGDPIFGLTIA
jgi:AhpD family alkylhydroperoxidase